MKRHGTGMRKKGKDIVEAVKGLKRRTKRRKNRLRKRETG